MTLSSTDVPRILLVDDSPSNILLLGEELRRSHEVLVATDGETALRRAVSEPHPDLILLDVMMPGMDGYEVCRRLKNDERTRGIPIIFLTARNAEDDETKGLDLGAVDYITKPFSLPIVHARVRTHLDLKRKSDLLETLSQRDSLTGVFNRRRFDEVFLAEWKRALRGQTPLSLLMMDIDCFKAYNDAYGHLAGDQCLRSVAGAVSATLHRPGDFLARYGGEEFVAVLSETDVDGAAHIAERIRKTVEDLGIEHGYSPAADRVTLSIGAASTVPRREFAHQMLIEIADSALYDAKQNGRNRMRHRQF